MLGAMISLEVTALCRLSAMAFNVIVASRFKLTFAKSCAMPRRRMLRYAMLSHYAWLGDALLSQDMRQKRNRVC